MTQIQENLPALLAERVAEYSGKTFLISEQDGREWSYREFQTAVNEAADRLIERGITKGDVVSLLMPNSAEYIISYFACWQIGAIGGPINSLLKDNEIEWVRDNSDSKLLLTDTATSPDAREPPVRLDRGTGNTGVTELTPDDTAIIIYTSGTTGKPKGCMLSHGNLIANARQIADWMGFGPDDRLLTVMPLFHMNAVSVTTMTALYAGGSTVIAPKFSASRFWEIIDRYRVTSFGSVATMLSMLLSKSQESGVESQESEESLTTHDSRLSTLRFAMCGSAPVPVEVLKRFEETFGVLVVEGYGLSESTCRSTFNPPNETRRPGSCGMAIGNEMKIFDETDREVQHGELGEIVMRGPNVFKGYFKNEEATKKAFENGWFHTGDIGFRDDDGFFYIADRKSDMIVRGGENIYPREIDDLLYAHPAVAAAAVVGVPDELYGEEVAAFIVLQGGASVSEQEVIEFCRERLADFKCPKRVYFVDDIPKGPTGKLLKRALARLIPREHSAESRKAH